MNPIVSSFEAAVRARRLVGMATVLDGPLAGQKLLLWPDGRCEGHLGDPLLDCAAQERARTLFAELRAERLTVDTAAGPVQLFIDIQPPPPRLIIVGGVHIAIQLATMAKTLNFETYVVDSRTAFATPERFAHVDRLITRWPADVLAELEIDVTTCIVVLTHDEKIDNPALAVAVRSPARYIGALGSRRTHAQRVAALQALGVDDAAIARIHSPIGLPIGARRPEEIALSIMAEIIAALNGVEEVAQ